jgi:hypothetical protein
MEDITVRVATAEDRAAASRGLMGRDLRNFLATGGTNVCRDDEGREYIAYAELHDLTEQPTGFVCRAFLAPPALGEILAEVAKQPELPGIESTLEERGKRYGSFAGEARACQRIRDILFRGEGEADLNEPIPDDCRQAAEMIVMKLVRAMRGDPNYADNWHDIAGYASLVEKRINAGVVRFDVNYGTV